MVMKTKDNPNKPHHSEHLSIWFSQSVQHHTRCIMNTKKKPSFWEKQRQLLAIFERKLIFFCAGVPATRDKLLEYKSNHVSVGPSPTPAVVNHPTKRSCILIQRTTNGNENKGQSQQAAPP